MTETARFLTSGARAGGRANQKVSLGVAAGPHLPVGSKVTPVATPTPRPTVWSVHSLPFGRNAMFCTAEPETQDTSQTFPVLATLPPSQTPHQSMRFPTQPFTPVPSSAKAPPSSAGEGPCVPSDTFGDLTRTIAILGPLRWTSLPAQATPRFWTVSLQSP